MKTIKNVLVLTGAVAFFAACGGSGSDVTIATDDPPQQSTGSASTGATRIQSGDAVVEGGAPAGVRQSDTPGAMNRRSQ